MIGYIDVKSSPVYFYVQRTANFFNKTNTPIPFDTELLNVGGAMNSTSGKFTAPRDGIYSFSFTGLARLPASSLKVYLRVEMYLNGNSIGGGHADEVGTTTFSFQSTLELKKEDKIWLEIYDGPTGASRLFFQIVFKSFQQGYLYGSHYTHFSGSLLEEKIAFP